MHSSTNQARIDVQTEREAPRGWSYHVVIEREGRTAEHEVSLSWVDHDYWCGGRLPPSRMVENILRYAVERLPVAALPGRFDLARLRRALPQMDSEVRVAG
jgi:hypothetical protein